MSDDGLPPIPLDHAGRAAQAKQLMEHPLLAEAFATLRDAYFKQWRDGPAEGQEARERLFMAARTLELVRSHLREVLNTGKIEAHKVKEVVQLQEKRTLTERLRTFR